MNSNKCEKCGMTMRDDKPCMLCGSVGEGEIHNGSYQLRSGDLDDLRIERSGLSMPIGITQFLGAPQGGPVTKTAAQIVQQAADEIAQRGTLRDKSSGERSMKRTVDAFNGLLGRPALTEQEGWLFMCVLKMARATAGKHHLDDYTDLAGYAGLAGECGELAKAANEEVWQFNEGKVRNG